MKMKNEIYVQDSHLAEEVIGLRHGLICTIALLVSLLEERGMLEPGLYENALRRALHELQEDLSSPEAKVFAEFVHTLAGSEAPPLRM